MQAGGATGPLSWLTRGRIDVDAMFYMPNDYWGGDTHEKVMRVAHLHEQTSHLGVAGADQSRLDDESPDGVGSHARTANILSQCSSCSAHG